MRPSVSRGYCSAHYEQDRLGKELAPLRPFNWGGVTCAVCGEPAKARKLCQKHYDESRDPEERRGPLERRRARNLRFYYGLNTEQYDAMVAAQGGVCLICKRKCRTRAFLSVDHDHETGDIRGLLCKDCNTAIGIMGDNPELLEAAADYLRRRGYTSRR